MAQRILSKQKLQTKPVFVIGFLLYSKHPVTLKALFFQFFSIVWRAAMDEMQLKLINRNYYDPVQVQHVRAWRLQVWPGYVTTIRQQEDELMLCAEVTNKILRSGLVSELFYKYFGVQMSWS